MKQKLSASSNSTSFQAALGGGLAAALLSVVTVQDTLVALIVSTLAPLPIMIAALAIGWRPGLAAALIAAVVVALFETQRGAAGVSGAVLASGLVLYAINLSLPAWALARLVATAPPSGTSVEARDLGRVIAATLICCVVAVAIDFGIVIIAAGGFQAAVDMMVGQVETIIKTLFSVDNPLPKGTDSHELAKTTVAQFPVVAVMIWMAIASLNLWLAARIARALRRFPPPWPDLPRSFRVPRIAALFLAASLGLAFSGGLPGMIAVIVSSALTLAFAAQGLALVHDVTRGKTYRLPLLIIVYLTLATLFIVYALVGLADAGFAFRDRPRQAATSPEI